MLGIWRCTHCLSSWGITSRVCSRYLQSQMKSQAAQHLHTATWDPYSDLAPSSRSLGHSPSWMVAPVAAEEPAVRRRAEKSLCTPWKSNPNQNQIIGKSSEMLLRVTFSKVKVWWSLKASASGLQLVKVMESAFQINYLLIVRLPLQKSGLLKIINPKSNWILIGNGVQRFPLWCVFLFHVNSYSLGLLPWYQKTRPQVEFPPDHNMSSVQNPSLIPLYCLVYRDPSIGLWNNPR